MCNVHAILISGCMMMVAMRRKAKIISKGKSGSRYIISATDFFFIDVNIFPFLSGLCYLEHLAYVLC